MFKRIHFVIVSLLIMSYFVQAKTYKGAEYRTIDAYTYGRFETCYKPPQADGYLASFFTYHEINDISEWNELDFEVFLASCR